MREALQTSQGPVEIRELASSADMAAAEEIQKIVWGPDAILHCKEILIAVQTEGGLLAGAFSAGGELLSLVFGFPSREPGVMHSQLLATLPAWRGMGLGARLKWFQRDWCLDQGIHTVRWTVDPLRAANAELNLHRLGCTCSTYLVDFYGAVGGIDAGAPTDRLLMVWDLNSERVKLRAQRPPEDRGFEGAQPANDVLEDEPVSDNLDLDGPDLLIQIPADYSALSRSKPETWMRWRYQIRALFQVYFSRGYAVTEFTRSGTPAYLLTRKGPRHED